jgi:hypothetical protein
MRVVSAKNPDFAALNPGYCRYRPSARAFSASVRTRT